MTVHQPSGWPRLLLGLPVLFVFPGYVLVATLKPGSGASSNSENDTGQAETIPAFAQQLALALTTSSVLMVVLGRILVSSPLSFTSPTVRWGISAIVLAGSLCASYRHRRDPQREHLHADGSPTTLTSSTHRIVGGVTDSANGHVLGVTLICLLFIGSTVAVPAMQPENRGNYTEFYLLTGNESEGLEAGGYTHALDTASSRTLTARVENHQDRTMKYTVVVLQQRVVERNGTFFVRSSAEQDRHSRTVSPGRTWQSNVSATRRVTETRPNQASGRTRLVYLLYKGSAPPDPSPETASHSLHLWMSNSSSPAPSVGTALSDSSPASQEPK